MSSSARHGYSHAARSTRQEEHLQGRQAEHLQGSINTEHDTSYRYTILAAQTIIIHPHGEEWVPIRFKVNTDKEEEERLLIAPLRYLHEAEEGRLIITPHETEGAYPSCIYFFISATTSYIFTTNSGERPVRISANQVISMYEPIEANEPIALAQTPVTKTQATATTSDSIGDMLQRMIQMIGENTRLLQERLQEINDAILALAPTIAISSKRYKR